MSDLCAPRVRVIFELPQHFIRPHQDVRAVRLAYVEWFRPFRQPESVTSMYTATQAFCSSLLVVGVIALEDIVGACHLIPRFGTGTSWTHTTISTDCKHFFLNHWIKLRTFYLLRCT
jgi:hypothetical protein